MYLLKMNRKLTLFKILIAYLVILISFANCSSLFESELETALLLRVKRQIPFISSWFSSNSNATGNKDHNDISFEKKISNKVQHHNNQKHFENHKKISHYKKGNVSERNSRFLSLFTVIEFDNTACQSVSGDNGTCYPAAECVRRGGSANGKCAQGYGVCCVFSKSCGDSTNQNNTYFTHTGFPTSFDGTGSCQLTVHKCAPNVCQLKLEFDSFNIAQPGTNGVCNNDQFIISGSNTAIPIICGSNTGNHMYIDVGIDNSPITLSVITSGPTYSRSWKIKVIQIKCNALEKAPEGCLQYYQGVFGVIRSYNFDFTSGQQLSNQDYTSCIRTERKFCGIRYTACTDNYVGFNQQNMRSRAFSLTGQIGAQTGSRLGAQNCQMDWITIPCATNSGRVRQMAGSVCQDRICGDTFNSEQSNVAVPVFSYVKPFRIHYHSDSSEANDSGNRGYCLNYIQQPCTSHTPQRTSFDVSFTSP